MDEENLMISHNNQQNSIYANYDIDRVTTNKELRKPNSENKNKPLKPYKINELQEIAKSLGIQKISGKKKGELIEIIKERHNNLLNAV